MAIRIKPFLVFTLYFSSAFTSASDFVSPVQKWRNSGGTSYGDFGATPNLSSGTLPQLKGGNTATNGVYEGLRAGEFELRVDGKTLVIDQETNKVLAVWDSFNIAEDSAVKFVQPGADSVAVNMIDDQSPTAILGELEANGSVYLLNPNGILFGANSRVDTRGLIAAAMEMDGFDIDHQFADSDEKEEFLNESLLDGIKDGNAFLVNAKDLVDGTDELPRIIVKSGAQISSDNAPVLLAGPEVINEGEIISDQGQVVLAGTRKDLYLAVSDNDADLRGFLVEVDSGSGDERGSVVNAGSLVSNLGNVTLVASEILQAGKITATTSVDSNGSIRIIARDQAQVYQRNQLPDGVAQLDALYFDGIGVQAEAGKEGQKRAELPSVGAVAVGNESGTIVFGAESTTQVLPQGLEAGLIKNGFAQLGIEDQRALNILDFWHSDEARQIELLSTYGVDVDTTRSAMATDSLDQSLIRSRVIVEGRDLEVQSDATLRSTSGDIIINARENPLLLATRNSASDASIEIGEGAILDVSGSTVEKVSSDRNMVEVFVTSTEVRDTPFQKGGALLRKNVVVDVVEGTDLLDWQGSLDSIEKSVYERMTAGGNIRLYAEGSMLIDDRARLAAKGGYYEVGAGEVVSSLVSTPDGFISLSDADSDTRVLDVMEAGVTVRDQKWGERESFSTLTSFFGLERKFRDAYLVGDNAGSIELDSRDYLLGNVDFDLSTTTGEYQRVEAPQGGTLDIESRVPLDPLSFVIADSLYLSEIIPDPSLTDSLSGLNKSLFEQTGASQIRLSTLGDVIVDGQALDLGKGTSLELEGNYISLNSDIRSVGGNVVANTEYFDHDSLNSESGVYVDGQIDVSGEWTNDVLQYDLNRSEPINIDGGLIALNAQLSFGENAFLKSDGGAQLTQDGELILGDAGTVSLGKALWEAGDAVEHSVDVEVSLLDGTEGGLLRLFDDSIAFVDGDELATAEENYSSVFDGAALESDRVNNYEFVARNGTLFIDTEKGLEFNSLRFDLLNLDTLGTVGNADSLDAVASLRAPFEYEAAPTSVTFRAFDSGAAVTQENPGLLEMSDRASLRATPGSLVSFISSGKILGGGSVEALSGTIRYELNALITNGAKESGANDIGTVGAGTVSNVIHLDGATLDVSSHKFNKAPDQFGVSEQALAAGSIQIIAKKGFVHADQSNRFVLAGTEFQETLGVSTGPITQDRTTASGQVQIVAESGLYLDSRIDFGEPGGTAKGGTLDVRLDPNTFLRDEFDAVEVRELTLGADSNSFIEGDSNETRVVASALNKGQVTKDVLSTTNLHTLKLSVLNTEGSIDLPEEDQVAVGSIASAQDLALEATGRIYLESNRLDLKNHALSLVAPYLSLGRDSRGNVFQQPANLLSSGGSGVLITDTTHTDLFGNMVTESVSNIILSSSSGIRLNSSVAVDNSLSPNSFLSSADLLLETPMLWASSLSDYTLETSGDISITSGSNAVIFSDPLSAGSSLKIDAENILVDSAILAPHGRIEMNAEQEIRLTPNAFVSVSGSKAVPLGIAQAGDFSWGYAPLGGTPYRFDSEEAFPLSRNIVFDAARLDSQQGAVVDVSAGGQVFAREFVPGIEGSKDLLSGAQVTERFAIIPSQSNGVAPRDVVELNGSGLHTGMQVEIEANGTLPAGIYTVLPASYALLDGAYLLESVGENASSIAEGFIDSNNDQRVVGRYTELGANGDDNWQYFKVYDSNRSQIFGQYEIVNSGDFSTTKDFLANPVNNGGVSFNIDDSIRLEGEIRSAADAPLRSFIDLTSDNGIVVSAEQPTSGSALYLADSIFDAAEGASILLGGVRVQTSQSLSLKNGTITPEILIENANVESDDLLIVAEDRINIGSNSSLSTRTERAVESDFSPLQLDSDVGALLSIRNGDTELQNRGELNDLGEITIASNASIKSSGGIALVDNGDLLVDASRFVLGEGADLKLVREFVDVGDTGAGANIDSNALDNLRALELYSFGSILFSEALDLNVESANLTAQSLSVDAGLEASITASDTLELTGLSDSELAFGGAKGDLNLTAQSLVLSGNESKILALEVDNLRLNAGSEISFRGESNLQAKGDLDIDSPFLLASEDFASLRFSSEANVYLRNSRSENGTETPTGMSGIASNLTIDGKSIAIDTSVFLPAGKLSLVASDGDISLGENAHVVFGGVEFSEMAPDISNLTAVFDADASDSIFVEDMAALDFSNNDPLSGQLSFRANDDVNINYASVDELDLGTRSDLKIAASSLVIGGVDSISDGLQGLSILNSSGADGDLSLRLSASSDLIARANFEAERIQLENAGGALLVDGEILVSETIEINARDTVSVVGGALVVSESEDESNSVSEVLLSSENAGVQISSSSTLRTDSLSIFVDADAAAVNDSDIAISNLESDDIGSIDFYLTQRVETATLDELVLDSDISDANDAVSNLQASVLANIDSDSDIRVLPHLLYTSATDLDVEISGSNSILEFDQLGTTNDPGLLSLRAVGDITFDASLSAGVFNPLIDFSPVQIDFELESSGFGPPFERTWAHSQYDSPSLSIAAGVFDPSMSNALGSLNKSVRFNAGTFAQTGTGDLTIVSSGNIELASDAYVASLGRSVASDANGLPTLGDIPYFDLAFSGPFATILFDRFSGFSNSAGRIALSAEGDIISSNNLLASNHLTSIDLEASEVFPNLFFDEVQAQFAVLDELTSGVHSVGGGEVRIQAGGKISGLSASSAKTGFALGSAPDQNDPGQYFSQLGGTINLFAGDLIENSSVFGGDARIDVTSLGSIEKDVVLSNALTVVQGAGAVNIFANSDLAVDAIVNTGVAMYRDGPFNTSADPSLESRTGFDSYDQASLDLTSMSGDILFARDLESIKSLYESDYTALFANTDQFDSYLISHDVLPSVSEVRAMRGSVKFNANSNSGNVLSLYTSPAAYLDIYAYDSVIATGIDGAERGERVESMNKIQIPDFGTELALSNGQGLTYSEAGDYIGSSPIFAPLTTEQQWIQNHSSILVDRGDLRTAIRAETGNIGSEESVLGFNMPMPIDVKAGRSIINTGFVIQHSDESDLSSIVAGSDFSYPFFRNEAGALIPSANQELGVRIGGPGTLVVNAGGSIDLGTSRGIVSRGSLDNPNLRGQGADILLAAGFELPETYSFEISESRGWSAFKEELDSQPTQASLFDVTATLIERWGNDTSLAGSPSEVLVNKMVAVISGDNSATLAGLREQGTESLEFGGREIKLNEMSAGFALELLSGFDEELKNAIASDVLYESLLAQRSLLPEVQTSRFADKSKDFSANYWDQLWVLKLASVIDRNDALKQAYLTLSGSVDEIGFFDGLTSAFAMLNPAQKYVIAQEFVVENNVASGQEALSGKLSFEAFDRGYIAQARVLGDAYQYGSNAITLKGELLELEKNNAAAFEELASQVSSLQSGAVSNDEFNENIKTILSSADIGVSNALISDFTNAVASSEDILISESGRSLRKVLDTWGEQNSISFDPATTDQAGDINLLYTTVQTRQGGNISLFAPSGDIDVGQSAAQVQSLFVSNAPTEDRLGLLAFESGNISAISASEFNVNESRVIPLAGGNVSLWSLAGGIDAGRGAKTAIATPPARYQVSGATGLINKLSAPAVSGSGISTRSKTVSDYDSITNLEAYHALEREGSSGAFLTTPLGIVDAGEAGIQSAGDLFIAAQEVVGADNISAGGISAGVPVATSISSDIGGLGSAVDAATNSVQESAENSATDAANQRAAFVTIELL